ncbi:MAG: hypothetical protein C0618_02670 [Desulfuromonas sp.]|nr:MAG: hypothetical protein C0618_02670 [Desulfuromonas sp.]
MVRYCRVGAACLMLLCLLAGNSWADCGHHHGDFSFHSQQATDDQLSMLAMATGEGQPVAKKTVQSGSSLQRWHKYLGYGTVLLAGTTAATKSNESLHESLAYATAAGALSTVVTGMAGHGHRFDLSEGLFTRDNLHIAMGTLGAVLLTTGVAIADDGKESSHSGLAVGGGALMTLGIIDIVW